MGNGAYDAFDDTTKQYVSATNDYNQKDKFPDESLVPKDPKTVKRLVDEHIVDRNKPLTESLAKNPMNSVPLP
ncbi:hypothetical protein F4827_004747 [Paraburkholderia bannensis]|uniref:Uncharacterized protein n=1 Tax=Paraburkholderia bannensis TaxID=765414 RepID=A0A7W9U0M9_9BURK|nr:hypothetical protein [Paraburkholderia sp. WP4_3_2]MBB6104882.1 hypothetical protein [Paraburkholderia bannensis]